MSGRKIDPKSNRQKIFKTTVEILQELGPTRRGILIKMVSKKLFLKKEAVEASIDAAPGIRRTRVRWYLED